jgi:tetratricopeptide (TPR) repeat protein
MKKWLEEKEADKSLVSNKMNDQQRVNYSWYLADIGIYEHFAKSSFISSLSYLDKAKNIIQGITTKPELEFTILMQLAQTKIYGGDISGAEKNIIEVDSVIQKNLNADFDMGLYWFIKTRILMAKGRYNEAISAVDNNIKAEAHLPRDTFTAPTYILKSEILNYMGNFKDSYEVITMIQRQEMSNKQPDHELHGRILTQLSRAELGLGLLDKALEHAVTACNIFQKEIIKYNITSVMNPEFAAALVSKGDSLFKKNKLDEAVEAYNEAETIYFRKYGDNYRYMDDISYLLSQGSKAACTSKNHFWKKHFYDQMIANFGTERPRAIEAIAVCDKIE